MTESKPRPRRRILRNALLALVVLLVVAVSSVIWYVRTDAFQKMVNRRLVTALEHITGGRVELGKFNVVPFRFRVEVHDLTIHGKESPKEVPYAHIDHLVAYIKIISIFEKEYGFSSLTLEHPVVHIIVHPDGSTNQPNPRLEHASERTPIEQLFSLSIGRLAVTRGELLWDNERIPLDFAISDFAAEMNFSLLHGRYESSLHIGKVDAKVLDFRPFASTVQVQFALGVNHIEIPSLRWTSGRSHVEASGRIDNFRDPHITANYNARVDLFGLASVVRSRELQAGTLEIGGHGTYSAQDFVATGKALIKDLEYRDENVQVRRVALSADYNVDRAHLKLSQLQARLWAGTATGEMDVTNWLNEVTFGPQSSRNAKSEQRGLLTLRLRDFSVPALSAAFSTRKLPLDRLAVAGVASGSFEAKWKGRIKAAELSFVAEVTPPPKVASNEIPLKAQIRGVYRGAADELELTSLDLTTRATEIGASGKLSASSTLKFSVGTTNLAELQPVITMLHEPRIPAVLQGRANFVGTVVGRPSNFVVAGHLQTDRFFTRVPATDSSPEHDLQWDSLVADVQFSPRLVSARNGVLIHGETSIRFDVSATLHNGDFIDSSPFTAHANVHNAELADLQSFAGYSYPVTGRANLNLQGGGTKADPHVDGHLELTDAVAYGQPLSHFQSDFRVTRREGELHNIDVFYHESHVAGGAAYGFANKEIHFNLKGEDFDLARISGLQNARITVDGRMDFTAQGAGTLQEPVVNANVHIRNLAFAKERAGDFTFDAVTHGAELQLTGRSQFEKAQLAIDGNVHLRGDFPADLALKFDQLDIDPALRRYLGDYVTGHSTTAGNLQLKGPLREPSQLAANGDLTNLALDLEHVRVQNEGPVRFTVAQQVLTLQQLRLKGEDTDLSAHGTVQLTGQRTLDLRADGHLNMKLIEGFSPELTSSGIVTAALSVTGTFLQPILQGSFDVENGALSSMDLPNGLSNINGSLVFNQDRLQIQTLTAQIGGGNVNLAGYLTYSPKLSFNITASGQDVRLRPAGVSATSTAELHLSGTSTDALLSGDVTIMKLGLTPGFDFARYLEGSKQTVTLPQSNPLLNKVRLDVHVVTTPELQMQSSLGKLSGDADLRLRGTLIRPVVLGRVDIMEGDIYFNGTKYRLERGEITFTGPVGIKPTLDLEASTRVRDYDVSLGVNGTPEKLNFTYRSEPPLPTSDIIALLAVGRTQEESAALASASGGSAFSQEASNVILSQALNATISNRAQRLFGISRIKVDPQGLNTETTPTHSAPAVTIEQQVSNDLTLSYSTEVSQATQQIIQGEYNVTRNISIRAVRDQNGVLSFDVRLRHRRK